MVGHPVLWRLEFSEIPFLPADCELGIELGFGLVGVPSAFPIFGGVAKRLNDVEHPFGDLSVWKSLVQTLL